MPATVNREPLAVVFAFPNGASWTADLAHLPNPQLALDLANGLAQLVHPHGTITAKATAVRYAVSIRKMVAALSIDGFVGGAADLTTAAVLRFWLAHSHDHERNSRRMLGGFDTIAQQLRPEVRQQIVGRMVRPRARTQPYEPYTEAEWQRLTDCCTAIVEDAWQQHGPMVTKARNGVDPARGGISEDTVAWWMAHDGPTNVESLVAHMRRPVKKEERRLAGQLVPHIREALFPTHHVQLAYRVLFGIQTGIVPDGIDDLAVDAIEWAGDAVVLLSYVKGRTGPEGANLPAPAIRLLARWLDHSALLRRFAPPGLKDTLWISTAPASMNRDMPVVSIIGRDGMNAQFVRRHGLIADDGSSLPLHRGRIRTTYQNLLSRRGWTGRTTIDPNHSAAVEGDHYLTAMTPAQRDSVESIIEQGQSDIVRKALPPTVLSGEQTADLVAGFPVAIGQRRIDDATVLELVGGEQDVFVAACTDQLAGQWGPVGKPCPARPWVCLMCPLAVFLPRHAPNLLRLKAFFARQFRQMPAGQFVRVFGPYANRLDHEILPLFDLRVLDHATTAVRDDDTEIPLRPEETTT